MHELGMASAILDAAQESLREYGNARLLRVEVAVGALTAVEPDNLVFCFGVLAQERPGLAGAQLQVVMRPLRLYCPACQQESMPPRVVMRCPICGDARTEIRSGEELEMIALEMETDSASEETLDTGPTDCSADCPASR